MFNRRHLLAALLAWTPALIATPQDEPAAQEPAVITIGEQGSDQDPLAGRDQGLAVEAQRGPAVHQVEGILGVPAMNIKVDPRVLGVAPGDPLPQLRREGETIRKRDGKLLASGERGYAVFIVDADPEAEDAQPLAMVVAPCMTLESMERLLEDRGDVLRFTITGQVHTYRGVNYLLPTSQPKPWLVADEPEGQFVEQPTEGEEQSVEPDVEPEVESEVESEGDANTGGDETNTTPTADEVLDQLLNERRDAPDPVAPPPREREASVHLDAPNGELLLSDPLLLGLDPDQPQAELKNEGDFLIARTGRLIRSADGAHALFVLDADGASAPEPPLVMQACKLLETMEKTVREQGDDVPFVVTGQVFTYRGANYLLPTIVKREFDRGNLE